MVLTVFSLKFTRLSLTFANIQKDLMFRFGSESPSDHGLSLSWLATCTVLASFASSPCTLKNISCRYQHCQPRYDRFDAVEGSLGFPKAGQARKNPSSRLFRNEQQRESSSKISQDFGDLPAFATPSSTTIITPYSIFKQWLGFSG